MSFKFQNTFAGTCNARFAKLVTEPKKSQINAVLSAATGKKAIVHYQGFRRKLPDKIEGKYSFCIFERRSKVPFLPRHNFEEIHFGFVLLIEVNGYVAVFSSRTRTFDEQLSEFSDQIDVNRVLTSVVQQQTDLRKLRAQAFSSGTSGCHSKTFEGVNLQSALGSLSNGRHLIRSLSTKRKGKLYSLNIDLRKVTRYGSRSSLRVLADWCCELVAVINGDVVENEFLKTFAEVVPLETAGEPISILFHTWELEHLLADRFATDKISFNLARRSILKLDAERAERYLKATTHVLGARFQLAKVEDRNEWKIIRNLDDENDRPIGTVILDRGRFRFRSERLGGLILRNEEVVERIPEVISRGHLFSISFSDPQYFYSGGMTVRDQNIQRTAQYLLNFIKPHTSLNLVNDEKGSFSSTNTFSDRSVFKYIEEHLSGSDGMLVCDDLGDEWADFVQFEIGAKPKIRFIHAKHRSLTAGATPFHDIVSQALKNLGHLCRASESYQRKLNSKWTLAHGDLGVQRIRKIQNVTSGMECIDTVIGSSELERSVVLAVSFFSKSDFENQIQTLVTAENHICQRVWLLSSFVSSCLELGIKPEVWSAP